MAYIISLGKTFGSFSFVMKSWAESFYKSTAWKRCRDSYMSKARGLCEDCDRKGLVTPATEVHHIIELTKDNISDDSITLSYDNLVALCHDCHMKRHHPHQRRYKVDEWGRVIPND